MFDAMYIGATGMRAHQTQLDTIAQNIANVNTTGFRRSVVSFADVSASMLAAASADVSADGPGSLGGAALIPGAGSLAQIALSSTAGELKQTGEPLNIAIDGPGFIEVLRPDGTPAYTRAGALRINGDNLLAAADGSPLAARIEFPPDTKAARIDPDGKVYAIVNASDAPVELGQIELVTFSNPAGLEAAGSNLYVATAAAGTPQVSQAGEAGVGSIRQGFLESSNVQLIDELVSLMLAQRAFEFNGKVVQAADQMMSITNGLYR